MTTRHGTSRSRSPRSKRRWTSSVLFQDRKVVYAEELVVRGRLIEVVLVDDHELRSERRDGTVPDPDDAGSAVEGATHCYS
jgi:hypothetical protein